MGTQLQKFEMALPIGSINAYISRVNTIPMLTAEEELCFSSQFHQTNNLKAARRLVLSHLRFVVKIARGYAGYGLSQADLIQEGNVGLMKAVKRFDPKIGVRLVSFAVHWIKAEIYEFILRNWRIVKIATTKAQRKLFFNLRSAKKRLGWFTKSEVEDVAQTLNVPTKTVLEMEARLNAHDAAYDGTDSENDSEISPSQYLADPTSNPALALEQIDWSTNNNNLLHEAIGKLDTRSRLILQKRWLTEKKCTLQILATELNISIERVRQLEQKALESLKVLMINAAA